VTFGSFSPGPPVSSTNKTYRHDMTEILLKVALCTINQHNDHKKKRQTTTYKTLHRKIEQHELH
jgi:hypothetical protein